MLFKAIYLLHLLFQIHALTVGDLKSYIPKFLKTTGCGCCDNGGEMIANGWTWTSQNINYECSDGNILNSINPPPERDQKCMLMVGGWTNQEEKTAGCYNPAGGSYCKLPPLTPPRNRHSVTGMTACGGWRTENTCSTFNLANGQWEQSYSFSNGHETHVAWKNSKGILLMGGYPSLNKTTLLLPGGAFKSGFDLVKNSWFSCAIEDPNNGSIILLGGYSSDSSAGLKDVIRYGEEGFLENLPDMIYPRSGHGCAGYYDDTSSLVLLVFGGDNNQPTEIMTIGKDSVWRDLGVTTQAYPFAATINNEIFMKGCIKTCKIIV